VSTGEARAEVELPPTTPSALARVTPAVVGQVTALGTAHPFTVFVALLQRDVRVARRELPYFLVRTVMQPVLFIVVFGYLLPKMGFVRGAYTTALLPGVLAISLTLSAIQSVALPMVQDFGWTHEIEDRLLAPIPVPLIGVEKIVVGVLQGIVAAVVVLPTARLIMGPIPDLTLAHVGAVVIVTLLGAATFSALGLLIGSVISAQQIGLMFSVLIAPMIFFGCAYYPWRGLDAVPIAKYAVLINPLVYVAEGMRAVLTPDVPHMSLLAVTAALVISLTAFCTLGIRSFMRRAVG
jgi:ABC-2 type transport system permease protein